MIVETDKKVFDFNQFKTIRNRAIGRLLWRLKRHMDSFVEPHLHQLGFADFKMSYLTLLANIEENGITNNELARRACVTKQMMSKTVGLLETEGYIYTQKNPTDSRSSVIFLNERGKELFLALRDVMQAMRDKFDDIAGYDRIEQLVETLVVLVSALENEDS